MSKDLNYIAGLEKAIKEKYGEKTIVMPNANWNEQKEEDYRKQVEERIKKERHREDALEKIEVNGILISKKLLNRESKRKCPVCGVYSFDIRDDVYMNKFQCCFRCYGKYVEGREERWNSGWRPQEIHGRHTTTY